jgi:hypothetical protein
MSKQHHFRTSKFESYITLPGKYVEPISIEWKIFYVTGVSHLPSLHL